MSKKERAKEAARKKTEASPDRTGAPPQHHVAASLGVIAGGGIALFVVGGLLPLIKLAVGDQHQPEALAQQTLATLAARGPCSSTLPLLDVRHLTNASRLPPMRCPVKLLGVAEWCGAGEQLGWDWDAIAASSHEFEYDVSDSPQLTYW